MCVGEVYQTRIQRVSVTKSEEISGSELNLSFY